jgi:hypothetical protein
VVGTVDHEAEARRPGGRAGHRPEVRQLFARDLRLPPEAPLVYLEVGQAELRREECRAGCLVCPMPDCPDPRLITRGGTRRDHFAHRRLDASTVHAPERWYHLCAKELVGRWLQDQQPGARVQIDHERVGNGQMPDVLLELPDGRRLAVEVQYAALSEAAWQRRHDGYVAQGIADLWLFGHIPPHLRLARGLAPTAPPRYRYSATLEAVELAGGVVRWIDPDARMVLTPSYEVGWRRAHTGPTGWLLVKTLATALAECWLDGTELRCQLDLEQAEARQAHLVALRSEARRRAIVHRQEEEHRRAVDTFRTRQTPDSRTAWEAYRQQKFRDPERIPPILSETTTDDALMPGWHPVHWHARLFEVLVQRRIGSTFSFDQASALFEPPTQAGLPRRAAVQADRDRALRAYLLRLRQAGYVQFTSTADDAVDGPIRVLADTHTVHSTAVRGSQD